KLEPKIKHTRKNQVRAVLPVDLGSSVARTSGYGRFTRRKYPNSWVWVVQLPSLGGLIAVSRPKAWATVHLSLTNGLPVGIFAKVVPCTFQILT
ncbi:hypothetical protein GW17_00059497, partial [Ensete ventricosum]